MNDKPTITYFPEVWLGHSVIDSGFVITGITFVRFLVDGVWYRREFRTDIMHSQESSQNIYYWTADAINMLLKEAYAFSLAPDDSLAKVVDDSQVSEKKRLS